MSISRINNNVAAITANYHLEKSGRSLTKSIERLSSGLRINRAGDDAAGLTIATRIRSQVRGLDRAIENSEDGINLINVAEGAMEEMTLRLDRMRVLAIQAANTGVNDIQARQALQDEVFQSIDEITRIAETTQFNTNHLLNGDFSVDAQIKPGQDGSQNYGIRIDTGPGSNTLDTGTHFLNIIKSSEGSQYLIAGQDENGMSSTMHCGVQNATDIAVSLARFSSTIGLSGTASTSATTVGSGGFFNGVSIDNGDAITFHGVLADGVTTFTGSLSASASSTMGSSTDTSFQSSLLGAINRAIDEAEKTLFGVTDAADVPSAFRTTVTLADSGSANGGRFELVSDLETFNMSTIDVHLVRGNYVVTQAKGVTRSGEIGTNSVLTGQGQIGNSVLAITGSTYDTGQLAIEVRDVQGTQNRVVEGTIKFRDITGAIINRSSSLVGSTGLMLNGTFVSGVYTGGTSITDGDTVMLKGTDADGTTFEAVYTFVARDPAANDPDTALNDFQFGTMSGLLAELNYRTRSYIGTGASQTGVQTRFETGVFTLSPNGTLELVDDLGRNDSQLSFTLVFNDGDSNNTNPYTITDDAVLLREGFAESATIRIANGPAMRVTAGEVVHYVGEEPTKPGDVRDEVVFRVGSNLKVGYDILEVKGQEFVGTLNGGPAVTFQNGAQNVTFIDNGSMMEGVARQLTIDFDSIIDVTASPNDVPDPGTTVVISVINHSMNFQIGAYAGQNFRTSIGDLTAQNLGYGRGSGRAVENIDITTFEGANEALVIIDEALDQINRTRSMLGAATNRLESTIANLSVASENLQTSESRLRDVDIAKETTNFTQSQILQQAGVSVLAQANFLPQSFLSLLG